jgi:hypothetical protein
MKKKGLYIALFIFLVQTVFLSTKNECQMSVSKTGVPCNVTWQAGGSHGLRIQNYPIADVRYEGITLHLQIMV